MRRTGSVGVVLSVLALCGMGWAQGPKTITVGAAGADFKTIQDAVNAAKVSLYHVNIEVDEDAEREHKIDAGIGDARKVGPVVAKHG